MSRMYPNNQDIEIFGEQVSWPGVDARGKFTNGSFHDPMQKPSFIPAETINLILDNLESLIAQCGAIPNATGGAQLAALVTEKAAARSIVQRDAAGRTRFGVPVDPDHAARLAELLEVAEQVEAAQAGIDRLERAGLSSTPYGFGMHQPGRNLLEVLGVGTIPEAMAELRRRCNGTGVPDFAGLQIGDYIDGLDLSGIPAMGGSGGMPGTAGQPWNTAYQNNRIVIAGFNTYKGIGNEENERNHVLFVFRNAPLLARVNSLNGNEEGYRGSLIRAFLEGTNGDGTGNITDNTSHSVTPGMFLHILRDRLGGDYLLTVNRFLSARWEGGWFPCTLWLPSEVEIMGTPLIGAEGPLDTNGGRVAEIAPIQIPLFQMGWEYRIRRYNGVRQWYSTSTPADYSWSSHFFAALDHRGQAVFGDPQAAGGCAPAFCVA